MKKIFLFFAAMLTLLSVQTVNAQINYEYVDLGLPSGTLWATCNVGANSPEEFGDYFAWGETEPYYQDGYAYSASPLWKPGKEDGYYWTRFSAPRRFRQRKPSGPHGSAPYWNSAWKQPLPRQEQGFP